MSSRDLEFKLNISFIKARYKKYFLIILYMKTSFFFCSPLKILPVEWVLLLKIASYFGYKLFERIFYFIWILSVSLLFSLLLRFNCLLFSINFSTEEGPKKTFLFSYLNYRDCHKFSKKKLKEQVQKYKKQCNEFKAQITISVIFGRDTHIL